MHYLKKVMIFAAATALQALEISAQTDTLGDKSLRTVTISAYRLAEQRVERLPDIKQTYLYAREKKQK
jgi:hypothetical protein